MKLSKLIAATSAIIALSIGMTSFAETAPTNSAELTGTLKKIKSSGKITLGVRDASIPFSYLDDKQVHQGYSIDLCMKVVDAVRKQLAMPDLKVVMNPVTSATRVPLMTNGTIDLECGSTTNNIERQNQVAFAPTSFISGTRLLAKKSSNIASLTDLKGKSVASTSGTAILKQLTALNTDQHLGMNIMPVKDHAEGFLMLETGRATAFAMDDILLASLAANSKQPNDYVITKEAISVEPYAVMLRKNDPQFKHLVDATFHEMYKSGQIKTIYSKWFTQPIPPKGINLNWPLSENIAAIFTNPTDSGDPSTYAEVPQNQLNVLNKKK